MHGASHRGLPESLAFPRWPGGKAGGAVLPLPQRWGQQAWVGAEGEWGTVPLACRVEQVVIVSVLCPVGLKCVPDAPVKVQNSSWYLPTYVLSSIHSGQKVGTTSQVHEWVNVTETWKMHTKVGVMVVQHCECTQCLSHTANMAAYMYILSQFKISLQECAPAPPSQSAPHGGPLSASVAMT